VSDRERTMATVVINLSDEAAEKLISLLRLYSGDVVEARRVLDRETLAAHSGEPDVRVLRAARMALGLNECQAAARIGCSVQSVRRWEDGVGAPRAMAHREGMHALISEARDRH